jgi:hypothetical protein
MMMFKGRPWVQITLAAAAGVSCLAVAACGSSTASGAAAPSASSTVDPLASLSAAKVNAEAIADAEAAPSLTIDGTASQSGKTETIDLGIKRGAGCTGTIGMGGGASMKLIVIGKTVYFLGNDQFWKSEGGSAADTSAAIALIDGRYLEVPASDKNVSQLAGVCSVSSLMTSDSTAVPDAKGPVTTLNGTRVVPVKLSDGSTDYVTDTSKPEFVEAFAPKGTHGGAGKASLSVGAPVRLTAPPPSQVIDGSKLGMTGSSMPSVI